MVSTHKGEVGLVFRAIDTTLDAIAGGKFYVAGDEWWCALTFLIILLSPVPQYFYIKFETTVP